MGAAANGREQDQFLEVIDRDQAERRFRAVLELRPLGVESIPLHGALGRVLAHEITAPVDVPYFDRSNVDGYAVRAADTFGASEERPRRLRILDETIATGVVPRVEVTDGSASVIATGGVLPRGADAVVMVEYTTADPQEVRVVRPVAPGANVSYAGTDIGRGEVVLRRGVLLSSRETGLLAAIGIDRVPVYRRPTVAIISTGNELVAPGAAMQPGLVYDSNATILADAVRELGAEPVSFGIVRDDESELQRTIRQALACDIVLLSGGTSKGAGDLSYRVVSMLPPPRPTAETAPSQHDNTPRHTAPSPIQAHGVALKPGKPICLAATAASDRPNIPVVILPGFPTSAIFTFHEFVAPVIRAMAGLAAAAPHTVTARLPLRVNSERGRTEYLLVGLVPGPAGLAAYPMGKGSGSVTTFSRADGFIVIPREQEQVDEDAQVAVHLLGGTVEPADLVAIGSHCVGLDMLLARLHDVGFRVRSMAVGSTAGLLAARRGECDVAGVHLLDPASDTYNAPFLGDGLTLVKGYARVQGLVFRRDDARFAGRTLHAALRTARADPACRMVNRNRGSGTRVLIDRLLGDSSEARPCGYSVEVRSHNAVAAAVLQTRADWGVAISTVARDAGLGFIPLGDEEFDFTIPTDRLDRPAIRRFVELLGEPSTRAALVRLGFRPH